MLEKIMKILLKSQNNKFFLLMFVSTLTSVVLIILKTPLSLIFLIPMLFACFAQLTLLLYATIGLLKSKNKSILFEPIKDSISVKQLSKELKITPLQSFVTLDTVDMFLGLERKKNLVYTVVPNGWE